MNPELATLLHPRVFRNCVKLYADGHYKHAALEAMTQVELALKEKSGVKNKYGVNLVTSVFGESVGIKLRVPFGEEMQGQAESLFRGAFTYYRNYAAHDGSKVDETTSLRVMILASELLDLIGTSALSFADIGGVPGLIKTGVFPDENCLLDLLRFLEGYTLPDEAADNLDEDLIVRGFTPTQLQALIEIGLVQYITHTFFTGSLEAEYEPETIGWFELTNLGKQVMVNLGKKAA